MDGPPCRKVAYVGDSSNRVNTGGLGNRSWPHRAGRLRATGSRSARSGLIQALRGEAPFDGRQFPPRPWGGAPVAAADIQFIADWIDDGCPAEDIPSIESARWKRS